jgi:hypothetical protein
MVQALRHLVAAAAVPRVVETRDVDTDEIVSLYACVGLPEGNLAFKTPHVLPPLSDVASLRIDDAQYFTVTLTEFPSREESVLPIIWLKKQSTAHQEEVADVETLRTICHMKQNVLFAIGTESREIDNLMKTRLELEWDAISSKILVFLKCETVAQRTAGRRTEDSRLFDIS